MEDINKKAETPEVPVEQTEVEKAQQAVKDMKEQNDRHEELTQRDEAAKVANMLGGTSTAGQEVKEEEKRPTPQEYVAKLRENGWQA